jgi:hypothetical protein
VTSVFDVPFVALGMPSVWGSGGVGWVQCGKGEGMVWTRSGEGRDDPERGVVREEVLREEAWA